MTLNGPSPEAYAHRRARLLSQLEHALLFLPAVPEVVYSNDVHYPYRQSSNVRYLSGFEEPASLLLAGSGVAESASGFTMFVRPRDAHSETWTGRRAGLEGARDDYGADHAHALDDQFKVLSEHLAGAERLYWSCSGDARTTERVMECVRSANAARPRNGRPALVLIDAGELIDEMRLVKEPEELEILRTACRVSAAGHVRLMERLRPGSFEYQAEALLEHAFRDGGCSGPAYGTIVAGGPNATVLHYTRNDRCLRDDDLILVDAGGEYGGYCADITRTLPVGQTFSRAQAALYEIALAAQSAAIEAVRPGASLEGIHDAALHILVDGLMGLGLLSGASVEECIASRSYEPFYMHRTSHWLGMDVHDVGRYRIGEKPRELAPGMVLTVEPGIYVREDAAVADEYRGIGIRIEDDVAVTPSGCEVLTSDAPKDRATIERLRSGVQ